MFLFDIIIAMIFDLYCDESCHLNNPAINVMGFGAIRADDSEKKKLFEKIAELKKQYNCLGELKWVKVSPKNIAFYKAIIDFFSDTEALSFSTVIIQDKSLLNHEKYNKGSEDVFYYKMYFLLLKNIISRIKDAKYKIYLDIKKKHSAYEVMTLKKFLRKKIDSETESIEKIQTTSSDEISLLQLSDFLLGAVMYANRFSDRNTAKSDLVKYLEEKTGVELTVKTKYENKHQQKKIQIFVFNPEKEDSEK